MLSVFICFLCGVDRVRASWSFCWIIHGKVLGLWVWRFGYTCVGFADEVAAAPPVYVD